MKDPVNTPSLILLPAQCTKKHSGLGSKTVNLARLMEAGLPVPHFVAIPAEVCANLMSKGSFDAALAARLTENILSALPAKLYAARSSALVEDSVQSSMAGQFHTEIAVPPERLAGALQAVIEQANKFLHGDLKQFSLLVQEYIEADFSGVVFTRDPKGRPETVLDYHAGAGEELVSGKITPVHCRFFPARADQVSVARVHEDLPGLSEQAGLFMAIEKLFGFPQDIEWCVRDKHWYFLQSRPITTLSAGQFAQSLYLDRLIPAKGDFLWEKNEISEIAPRPLPFTWSLLRKIYAGDGPVSKVYAKHGIKFQPNDFLKKIGNELFVDRELELRTLLPSFSYFGRRGGVLKPGLRGRSGFGKTIGNWWNVTRLKPEQEQLQNRLGDRLSQHDGIQQDWTASLEIFLQDYALIFEINLFADKALNTLRLAVAKEPVTMAEVLGHQWTFVKNLELSVVGSEKWLGNSLEVNDMEPFRGVLSSRKNRDSTGQWWKTLPAWKRPYFQKIISEVVTWMRMREYGRFLTVKNINVLRNSLLDEAKRQNFSELKNIFFATIGEITGGNAVEAASLQAKTEYDQLAAYTFPSRIGSKFTDSPGRLSGVSSGKASGKLIVLADDSNGSSGRGGADTGGSNAEPAELSGAILYTKLLTPDLTRYFDRVAGIVSEEGGLLSHLAIMARESHIPVVVGFDLAASELRPGDNVAIDGDSGEIKPA